MTDAADIADRDEQMLGRLAELDLAAAERVHGRLMAAEDAAEVADLGRTYQRLARSLRQTLALKARLKHDRERAAKEAAAEAAPAPTRRAGGEAVSRRIRELRTAVLRVAWNEAREAEGFDWFADAVEDTIVRDCLREGFGAEPLDEHVLRVCALLGLAPDKARGWRDLPDPPPAAVPREPPPWRSSA